MKQVGPEQPTESGPDYGQGLEVTLGDGAGGTNGGIGSLLREEREKKGLSYSQVFEITRVRPHLLEALENEDWDRLPPPGFVTGLAKSYARALGLDEDEVVRVYQRDALTEETPPGPPVLPLWKRKGVLVSTSLILIFLAGIFGHFIWREYTAREEVSISADKKGPPGRMALERQGAQQTSEKGGVVASAKEREPAAALETIPVEEDKEVPPDDSSKESEAITPPAKNAGPGGQTGLVLKAVIKERTWVRISVDDQPPREYIFEPGSDPVWSAKAGFELLIGNAGGIALELNGQRIEGLGKRGQVVRLKLPRDNEQSSISLKRRRRGAG